MSVIMTEETLRDLIAGGETGTVEFKIKAPRPAELAERICGMAGRAQPRARASARNEVC